MYIAIKAAPDNRTIALIDDKALKCDEVGAIRYQGRIFRYESLGGGAYVFTEAKVLDIDDATPGVSWVRQETDPIALARQHVIPSKKKS